MRRSPSEPIREYGRAALARPLQHKTLVGPLTARITAYGRTVDQNQIECLDEELSPLVDVLQTLTSAGTRQS